MDGHDVVAKSKCFHRFPYSLDRCEFLAMLITLSLQIKILFSSKPNFMFCELFELLYNESFTPKIGGSSINTICASEENNS